MWNSKVIIACDFSSKNQLLEFLANFHNEKLFLKLGMEFIYNEGFAIISELKEIGHQIFIDLKLHDITETVKKTLKVLSQYKIDFLTIHLMCGINTLIEANKIAKENNINLLGVTLLTNLDDEDLASFYAPYEISTSNLVQNLAFLADKANLFGVVCSAWESKLLKGNHPHLQTVTPGVKTSNEITDQKRVFSPAQAKELGSDFIVVGRAITNNKDPYRAYLDIVKDFS